MQHWCLCLCFQWYFSQVGHWNPGINIKTLQITTRSHKIWQSGSSLQSFASANCFKKGKGEFEKDRNVTLTAPAGRSVPPPVDVDQNNLTIRGQRRCPTAQPTCFSALRRRPCLWTPQQCGRYRNRSSQMTGWSVIQSARIQKKERERAS